MADEVKRQREVIAHFSMPAVAFGFVGWLAFVAGTYYFARYIAFEELNSPAHSATDRSLNVIGAVVNGWGVILFTGLCIYMLVVAIRLFRDARACQGDALWIEGGRLCYANKKILDVSLRDIVSVDLNTQKVYSARLIVPYKYITIMVRLRDGKEVKFPARQFVENRDDLVAQIRERAGLPPVA